MTDPDRAAVRVSLTPVGLPHLVSACRAGVAGVGESVGGPYC
jgi:hypothetical protein